MPLNIVYQLPTNIPGDDGLRCPGIVVGYVNGQWKGPQTWAMHVPTVLAIVHCEDDCLREIPIRYITVLP